VGQQIVRRRGGEEAKTKLIVIISTWHFTRDNEKTESPTIHPTDVTVQFKYSSSEFQASTDAADSFADPTGYSFDKNGLIFTYPAFVNLLRSKKFSEYLKKCNSRRASDETVAKNRRRGVDFDVDSGSDDLEIVGADGGRGGLPEVDDDNNDKKADDLPLKKKSKHSKSPAVVEGPVGKKFKYPNPPPPPGSPQKRPSEEEIAARLTDAVKTATGGSSRK